MAQISHALVLPDANFEAWLAAVRPYIQTFEQVAVVRSPAGNDLNRFRDVTAVQFPQTWMGDDALMHIRRVYPMVVRVDVIRSTGPDDLRARLQRRIDARDRFGETVGEPTHIHDRFILEWPSDARPARILKGFSAAAPRHEGIDIHARNGATISAAAGGMVTAVIKSGDSLGYGPYVTISSQLNGEQFVTTYTGLRDIKVTAGQVVETGDAIAFAAGDVVKLVVQGPGRGQAGFKLPDVLDPIPFVYLSNLRLRTTASKLRVRSLPSTAGEILTTVTREDVLETREMHGRTLLKVGVEDEWLRIERARTRDAYAAAWYLEAYSRDDPVEAIPGIPLPGMNLDIDNTRGMPEPTLLNKLGWVRLLYNVSLNPNKPQNDPKRYGNTDLNFTLSRYRPYLQRIANAGLKTVLVFTHQTFGEGQGYHWGQMNSGRWRDLTRKYAEMVGQIAAQFKNTGLVYAYQIWNEQDTDPEHYRAAVPVPAADYAHLLTETIRAIRAVDSETLIITGGHVSGPDMGSAYAQATINAMPSGVRPDGIAFHPYGNGPAGSPYTVFATLDGVIRKFARVLPDKPVWITEWGVLDRQNDTTIAGPVSQYATGFLNIITREFPGQVACAIWYAWSDGMDNGYGLVKKDGSAKQPLYDTFLKG